MVDEIRMHVCMLRVRLGLVLGSHPKIILFGLHYYVICCEVETLIDNHSLKVIKNPCAVNNHPT